MSAPAIVLLCDAIGIVILHQLGMNTSRLMAGVEKISRFNRERLGTALNRERLSGRVAAEAIRTGSR
jgi:hypothetical protein